MALYKINEEKCETKPNVQNVRATGIYFSIGIRPDNCTYVICGEKEVHLKYLPRLKKQAWNV